jgi:hypothetical protein
MATFNPTLFSWGGPPPIQLFEDEDCRVTDRGSVVELQMLGEWSPTMGSVIKRFGVQQLVAAESSGWVCNGIEFLDEVPASVVSFWLAPSRRISWGPLVRRAGVRSLTIFAPTGVIIPLAEPQEEIDFTRLTDLESCSVTWIPEWDSALRCSWLKGLLLRDSAREGPLDLGRMLGLEELVLERLVNLQHVNTAESAMFRALKVSHCPKLDLDLNRFVRDLELLWLEGHIRFPLSDLVSARSLRGLVLTFLKNRIPIPPFLASLGPLCAVEVLQTRLSKSDMEILEEIWRRRRATKQRGT